MRFRLKANNLKTNNPNTSNNSGMSLIEIIVATAVVGLFLTAILTSMSYSSRTNTAAENRALATSKAQEIIEFFRKERTKNGWAYLQNSVVTGSSYCLNVMPADLAGLDVGSCENYSLQPANSPIAFKREVTVNNVDNDEVSLTVTVSWLRDATDGENEDHQVILDQVLKNW